MVIKTEMTMVAVYRPYTHPVATPTASPH